MQRLFDEVVRLAREKGMSLAAVERKAGLGTGTVRRWQGRIPRASSIAAVAEALGTDRIRLARIAMEEIR